MCGIVGIAGTRDVAPIIVEALKRLEYRGYDSAGVATLVGGKIERRRAPGKLTNLEAVLREAPLTGHTGIGHTRWATHGAPTEANAHPHATARVAIVHNGIIENFRELREELTAKGHKFQSETDSETAAHLVTDYMDQGLDPEEAAKKTIARLIGAYSIAMIFKDHEGLLVGARKGPPLAVGYSEHESYLGSDAFALAPFTNRVAYLLDGDVAVVHGNQVAIFDAEGRPANREIQITSASAALIDKAGHNHFMAKEIHEQPEVVGHTLAHYLDPAGPVVRRQGKGLRDALVKAQRLTICACGTSFYAGMVGKYWFEKLARFIPKMARRCSFPSLARPPTLWRRCAMPRRKARPSSRWSMSRNPASRGKPISCCPPMPGRKSELPRPRPSPASLRRWPVSPSPPARRAAPSAKATNSACARRCWRRRAISPNSSNRKKRSRCWARKSPRHATCFIWAAAPAIRSRWKAR
jgi:glucosamine--fructose-6-phosphate aminotransferase (isomerizing)